MLTPSVLTAELQKIFDQESSTFEGFPESHEVAAERWANAFDSYAKSVTPPSLTSAAAKSAFQSTFLAMNESNGLIQFPLCFLNYAVALAPGMAPLYAGVPPVSPPNLTPVFSIGYGGGKSIACINQLVSILDAWMRTGQAIHSVTGVTIPWS